MSENYSKIKAQLISDYGSVDRYYGGSVYQEKTTVWKQEGERYQFYVNLTKAVSRLDKLC